MLEATATAHPYTPALTPNAVKAILQYTAFAVRNDAGIEYDPLREGAGALNGAGRDRRWRARSTPRATTRQLLAAAAAVARGRRSAARRHRGAQAVIWGNAVIWGSTIR